jgi:hypothetical protein
MLKYAWILIGAALLMALLLAAGPGFQAAAKPAAEWGTVEGEPILLVPPIDNVLELQKLKARNPWFFPGWTQAEVSIFLEAAVLPEPLRTALLDRIQEYPSINGCVLMPSDEEVMMLPSDARAWIYNHLSRYNLNGDQAGAGRFPCRSMAEWMEGIPVSDRTLELLESLAYRNGTLLFFADLPLLLSLIDDPKERKVVYTALKRVETLQLTMQLSEKADLVRLAQYWGAGGYESDVRLALEQAHKKGVVLDLAELLPPVPNSRLYQFPVEADRKSGSENCHWTAVNFFSPVGRERPCDADSVQNFIMNHCVRIGEDELRFGDIIVYLRDEDDRFEVVHSAVFIAGDVVFTKNGVAWFSPWMYMRMKHMDDYYRYGVPLRKIYIRRHTLNGI